MTTANLKRLAIAMAVIACTTATRAEDIDIYSSPTTVSGAPNVLLVMDNTANWSQSFSTSTKFAAEKAALATVINALTAQFNLGLALFTETGGSNSNTDGGYVRFGIQAMTNPDGTPSEARKCLLKMIGSGTECTLAGNTYFTDLHINDDKSNGGKGGVAMAEVYKYFSGTTAYAGHHKVKTDYTRVFTSGAIGGPTYVAPPLNPCTKNYVIVINNGPFSDNTSDTTQAMNLLSGAGGNPAIINPPDTANNNNAADEWTRHLNTSAVGAITYTLEVGPSTTGQGPYNTRLLQSMGNQGKGGYYSAINAQQLLDALQRIINDILATNSVFASASLPLSADNSGLSANQVYMGVFRPDAAAKPRWMGNLKQYKFRFDSNDNALLVDQNNQLASSASGFAQPDAVSFWTSKNTTTAPDATAATATNATNGSTGGFWYFDNKGSGGPYDSADGQFVEKGGAAQQLRLSYLGYGGRGGIGDTNASTLNSKPARKVYTCTAGCTTGSSLSGFPFEYNNAATSAAITTSALGAADATALQTLIKWIRGQDTANENNFQVGGANTDVRPSIHGDILHSRPIVLDFGGGTGVYIFYGGNDGVFRAVKGGQASTDGNEQWAFIPTEFFGKLKRLYDNDPIVRYPSTNMTVNPTATRRDYFFDGPVATYVERDANNAITKAYLYITMRRGGRFIYALNVTDPVNPKFLWKKSYTDSGFAELGQTWSQPTVATIAGSADPVLIFGAGYDNVSEDPEPPAASDTMGRAIYVLNAFTGAPIWAGGKSTNFASLPSGMSFTSAPGMDFSIAGEVLVVDRNNDGFSDRIYATDVGGNVWRVDIGNANPATWAIWKLASLADRSSAASTRKFLFGVDMVRGESFDAVFVGSGDREHPLSTNSAHNAVNRFYMIKDVTSSSGSNLGITDTCGASIGPSCSNLFDATSTPTVDAGALGWAVNFPNPGQKVVNRPLVLGGHILFGTNHPDLSNSQCSASLGIARRYDIAFDLAQTSVVVDSTTAPGGGFLPNPTVVVVTAEKDNGDGTTSQVTRVVAADNPLSPGLHTPSITVDSRRYRSYWREVLE